MMLDGGVLLKRKENAPVKTSAKSSGKLIKAQPEKYSKGKYAENNYAYGIRPFYGMCESEGTTLDAVTTDSLHGFVLQLNIAPDAVAPYADFTLEDKVIDARSFIIKMVIIDSPGLTELPPFSYNGMNYRKKTVSEENFTNEVNLQKHIWSNSFSTTANTICPSVAYSIIFKDNTDALELLNKLGGISERSVKSNVVLEYLLGAVNSNNYRVGFLLMPTIPNPTTLLQFEHEQIALMAEGKADTKLLYGVISIIIAQIVRMFIQLKVLHFDLHKQNVLLYQYIKNGERYIDSKIIDFGRASRIDNPFYDGFLMGKYYINKAGSYDEAIPPGAPNPSILPRDVKTTILADADRMYANFYEIINSPNASDAAKVNFMLDVMDYIDKKDHAVYIHMYPGTVLLNTLSWTEPYTDRRDIMLAAFNKLRGMMHNPRIGGKSKKSKQTKKSKTIKKSKKSKKSKTLYQ